MPSHAFPIREGRQVTLHHRLPCHCSGIFQPGTALPRDLFAACVDLLATSVTTHEQEAEEDDHMTGEVTYIHREAVDRITSVLTSATDLGSHVVQGLKFSETHAKQAEEVGAAVVMCPYCPAAVTIT